MMISRTLILAIVLGISLWGTPVTSQMAERAGSSSLQKEISLQFEDYPVAEEYHGKRVKVDLSSHPKARYFRTRLREGARKGPNFAGHYALAFWGCGNECQVSLVIDLRTGKVYGLAEPSNNQLLQSSRGLDFRPDSRLIIADPPCPKDYNPCVSFAQSGHPVRYYLMDNNGLKLIYEIPCKLVNERQRCGD